MISNNPNKLNKAIRMVAPPPKKIVQIVQIVGPFSSTRMVR